MKIDVIDIPDDRELQQRVARDCVEQWKRDFPHDTEQWYLDLYRNAREADQLPVVLIAMVNGEYVGTGSLIVDDELPNATEPGPWIAAVLVQSEHRGCGVGTALVKELVHRAHVGGIATVYLYTESTVEWYEAMGWTSLRTTQLSDHEVTVMAYSVIK